MFKPFIFFHFKNNFSNSLRKSLERQKVELIFDFSGKFQISEKINPETLPVIVNTQSRRFLYLFKCSNTERVSKTKRSIEYLKLLNFIERSIEENLSLAIVADYEIEENKLLVNMLNADLLRRGYKTRNIKCDL